MRATVSRLAVAVAVAAAALVGLGASAPPAGAAGVTTHAWMALEAIGRVQDPQLRALLQANREVVRSGASFPDTGYVPGNQYGEEAHWQRFHDAYLAEILARPDCGDLTAPTGPCAASIAHAFGAMAHGMGDQVWDWLFEPNSPDLDEYYSHPDFGSFSGEGGQELTMDLVAVGDFGQSTDPLASIPNQQTIVDAFAAVDFDQVDGGALTLGAVGIRVAQRAQGIWVPRHLEALRSEMPWMSHNLRTAPGGVDFAAVAIAGQWDSAWAGMVGERPATEVSITYPADGQRRIPATGWDRRIQAGSNRDGGGARTRVAAVLTNARPFLPLASSPGPYSSAVPTGAMRLIERDSGDVVPDRAGFPRTVPYGGEAGQHVIAVQPAADLEPCTWYRAEVTAAVLDARGEPVVPRSWEFRTGADGAGSRCADDPYTRDENFVRAVVADLLDRPATEQELVAATFAFDRGTERRTFTRATLDSLEHRELLVDEAFQRYLGRGVDPAGLAYWAEQLRRISIPQLHARLLASPEVFRKAGGTNAGYVAALYPLVHGRAVDPSGLAFWTGRLDRGQSRASVATAQLTSRESARRTVVAAYDDLLGRAPDQRGLDHWTAALQRGASPQAIWEAIISSGEYDRRAQG